MRQVAAKWNHSTILAIEDDAGDQEIIRRALHSGEFPAELRFVSDGDEAIEYLFRRGRYQAPGVSPRPDLILLDLNLPRISGMEVLQAAKGDSRLRSIPIVVVTTSMREKDVADAFELGCNSYVVKSLEARGFIEALRDIYSYWFVLCTFPSREKSLG